MTTRIAKEERSQQLTWNYKTWECSSTDSSDEKGRFLRVRQFSNAFVGFSLSLSNPSLDTFTHLSHIPSHLQLHMPLSTSFLPYIH